MTHPEIESKARNFYTLHEIEEAARTVGNIVYVVRVGDQPIRHQITDYLDHFRRTDLPVEKVTSDVIQVGGIRIYFVSKMDPGWKEKIAGYVNFIDE